MERPRFLTVRGIQKLQAHFREERPLMRGNDTMPHLIDRIKIEADEALEAYHEGDKNHLGDELADVIFFVLNAANHEGIDIAEALQRKFQENITKYPPEMFQEGGGRTFEGQYKLARHRWASRQDVKTG